MTDAKPRMQYGVDIAKPRVARAAEPVRQGAEKTASGTPLEGEDLVKAGQDLMENGA